MSELDSRKQTILRAIIFEYVGGAEPVGSQMLVEKYGFGVKSATVRNEMAELSELGYLDQPHTSAGRIPSDLAYRYYVDHMIVREEVGDATQQTVTTSSSEGDALQQVLRDTLRAMSRVSHLMGVATTLSNASVTVRHAVISALGPKQALLVLILGNGHVENRMMECPIGLTLEDIGIANEALNQTVAGKSLGMLSKIKATASSGNAAVDRLNLLIIGTIKTMAKEMTRGKVVYEGEEFMFGQPEFQRDVAALTDLIDQLKESDLLYESVAGTDQAQTVVIGRENRHERMHQLSVVRQSFFVGPQEVGVIALVGPTRMRYERDIPLVNFTAKALSQSLTRFFG